jgi:uncharacterized protein (DUF1778 family)
LAVFRAKLLPFRERTASKFSKAVFPRYATTIRFDDDYTRKVIDTAAAMLHVTRTAFLLNAAREQAEKVIRHRRETEAEMENLITLSPAAAADILETLENPPPPNEYLKQAMKEYRDSGITHRD